LSVKLEEKVKNSIIDVIHELGFDIEYVEYVKEGSDNILRVVIDKEGSDISIDDCELVSRQIDEKVEQSMGTVSYVLEVSSPGVERELKNEYLYKKYKGSNIHIKLFEKIDLGKEFDAKLVDYINDTKDVVIALENETERKINIKNIASAHTVYDFDKYFKENKK
jgi:ribosome maturation factor RimP